MRTLKQQHIKRLWREIWNNTKSRETNTRLLWAEAWVSAEGAVPSSLALSCPLPPLTLSESPAVHMHAAAQCSFPLSLLAVLPLPSPFFPNHRRAELAVAAAQKSAPKSLAQCKHVQGGLASRWRTVALLAHRYPSLTAPPLPVSGCLWLRLDDLALWCCWCTCWSRHDRVGWGTMTKKDHSWSIPGNTCLGYAPV